MQQPIINHTDKTMTSPAMRFDDEFVYIESFSALSQSKKDTLLKLISEAGFDVVNTNANSIRIPRQNVNQEGDTNILALVGKLVGYARKKEHMRSNAQNKETYPDVINFQEVLAHADKFSAFVKQNKSKIISTLLEYETFEVANDEIDRVLDLLSNLDKNSLYFKRKVNAVSVSLPCNQPLYALTCFAIVPSLMAKKVYVKAPSFMSNFFSKLTQTLSLSDYFPNIQIHKGLRQEFVKKCSQVHVNHSNGNLESKCDVVIFTGSGEKANMVRKAFSKSVLFIANGSGHNPIVVTETADIDKAVESSKRVQLYNQGQDCAGPNAILVHQAIYENYIKKLVNALKNVKVGEYTNRKVTVGPINVPNDIPRIQKLLSDNSRYLSMHTDAVIRSRVNIVEPTIIEKPLSEGGNYKEQFAPIFFIQKYDSDDDLRLYFENDRYRKNAMYITVYGESNYISSIIGDPTADENCVHDNDTVIYDTDLHAKGVERGFLPYGGYGRNASYIAIDNKVIRKPTLPQRDIYEQLIRPIL